MQKVVSDHVEKKAITARTVVIKASKPADQVDLFSNLLTKTTRTKTIYVLTLTII